VRLRPDRPTYPSHRRFNRTFLLHLV